MENKKHQKEKKISSLITFIIQSLICIKIFFVNNLDKNKQDLQILIVVSLLVGILPLISQNERYKSIGIGILFGSFITAMIFAILFFISIFFFYSKHSVC
jgi:hypothetical protein